MAKIHTVTEIKLPECEHLIYHRVTVPDILEKKGYVSAISLTYFFHGPNRRNRTETRLFHLRYEYDPLPIGHEFENVPIVHHASLWDFYEYIGWDKKKRKYISK